MGGWFSKLSEEQVQALRTYLGVESVQQTSNLFCAAALSSAVYEAETDVLPQVMRRSEEDYFVRIDSLQICMEHANHKYLIAENSTSVFVSFRGSHSFDDVVLDASLRLQPFIDGTYVHEGFLSRAKGIPDMRLLEIARQRNKQLVLCGHSLGGSIAMLVTLRLLSTLSRNPMGLITPAQLCSITFGAPLVGDGSLQRWVQSNNWHPFFTSYIAKTDVVPKVLMMLPSHLRSLARRNVVLSQPATPQRSQIGTPNSTAQTKRTFDSAAVAEAAPNVDVPDIEMQDGPVGGDHTTSGVADAAVGSTADRAVDSGQDSMQDDPVTPTVAGAVIAAAALADEPQQQSTETLLAGAAAAEASAVVTDTAQVLSLTPRSPTEESGIMFSPQAQREHVAFNPSAYSAVGTIYRLDDDLRLVTLSHREFETWVAAETMSLAAIHDTFTRSHRLEHYLMCLDSLRRQALLQECFKGVSLTSLGISMTPPIPRSKALLPLPVIQSGCGALSRGDRLKFAICGEYLDTCNYAQLEYDGHTAMSEEMLCAANELHITFPLPQAVERRSTTAVVRLANDFGFASLQIEIRSMHVLLIGATGAGKTSLFRVLLEDEGFTADFNPSHVTPDRSNVRTFMKGFLKFTDRRGIEMYGEAEMRQLEAEIFGPTRPDVVLFVHNIATRIHTDEVGQPRVDALLQRIRSAHIPLVYVLTNKYSVDSDERTGIVTEIQHVLRIPDGACFLINSRKKDTQGVEGINELLKGIYEVLDPELRDLFVMHLNRRRRDEFLRFLKPLGLGVGPLVMIGTGGVTLLGLAVTLLLPFRARS